MTGMKGRLQKFILNNKLPVLVLLVFGLVQVIMLITYPQSHRNMKVISWDTFGYYLYLPASFIHHDLFQLKFAEPVMHQYNLSAYFYAARPGPLGTYVMNYPLGLALLYFPFFCLGHLGALIFGYAADGFSAPYQYSVFVGGIFYSFIGLVFTTRNLRFFFSEKLTALLLVILLFGTNYFYYTIVENAMAHNYLFTIASLIIYLTIKWHQNQRTKYATGIGILLGLAVICRPTEILWCLIPLLWTIGGTASLKAKIILIQKNTFHLLCLVCGAFFMGLIQMIYWKAASGKFIYYSYDGTFDFLDPHILDGVFSLRKGWLVYTPVMALALLGLPLLWFKRRELFWVCMVYATTTIYITFAWRAWSYGGSFGQRPMVETYALFLFPMGIFINAVARQLAAMLILLAFILFCIFLNCFQTWQFVEGFLSSDGPNKFIYKVVFLRTHRDKKLIRDFLGLEQPKASITDSVLLYQPINQNEIDDTLFSGIAAWKIGDSTGKTIFDSTINTMGYTYLRIDGKAMFEPFQENSEKFSRVNVSMLSQNGDKLFRETCMPLQPLIGNDNITWERDVMGAPGRWDKVYMYVKLSAVNRLRIKVSIQNPGQNNLYFKNFRISLLKE